MLYQKHFYKREKKKGLVFLGNSVNKKPAAHNNGRFCKRCFCKISCCIGRLLPFTEDASARHPPLVISIPKFDVSNSRTILQTTRPSSLDLHASNVTTTHSPLLPQAEVGYNHSPSLAIHQSPSIYYSRVSEGTASANIIHSFIMGGSTSKETPPSDITHQPPRRKHTIFRRRSKSLPPRPPTFVFPPENISNSTHTVSNHPQPVAEQPTQDSHDSSNPTSTGQDAESQQPSIQTVPSTPPYEEGEKPHCDDHRTETPLLRLPTPSLMPEESPGKYGMDPKATPLRNTEQLVPRTRPKSGTGAQIFQVRCLFYLPLLHTASIFSQSTDPSQDACALQSTVYLNHLSHSEAEDSRPAVTSRKITSATSLATTASLASDLTSHPRFSLTYSLPHSPSLPAPAPPLTPMQVSCLHSHRILHRSKNNHAPVACMLCENADFEQRWRCHWCCLRMCSRCREKLETIESRDIAVLLKGLAMEGDGQGSDIESSQSNKKDPDIDVQ